MESPPSENAWKPLKISASSCVSPLSFLLLQAEKLLDMGIHPLRVAEGYEMACKVAVSRLDAIAESFDFTADDLEPLVRTCMTTLSSKM